MSEKEYIERESAIRAILGQPPKPHYPEWYYQDIKAIPAADVVEVRHGKWKIKSEIHKMLDDVDEDLYVECPFCKRTFWIPYEFEDEKILEYAREHYPYCNCGAKMDGGKHETD